MQLKITTTNNYFIFNVGIPCLANFTVKIKKCASFVKLHDKI